ncbi:hypothetical protein [Actinocorallia populi]|uniref:hypothetical protein n=1 Tax=Actinocorallia populi TaxID=2079200 RepID=UPI000D096D8A|nr:hypothetical protein [Actinocorallia populi]
MNDIRVVALRDADRDFGLRSLFSLHRAPDDAKVVVCVGDTALEGLPLDFRALEALAGLPEAGPFLGVAVYGDLTVAGGIINADRDFGPFLWVRGGVRTGNFAVTGSEVRIEGVLEAAQTIAGAPGRGRTVVKGDARAEVVLSREHLLEFHAGLTAELVVAGDLLRIADPGRVEVGAWSGRAHDLWGRPLPGPDPAATRTPHPAPGLHHLDGDLDGALAAIGQGRSLLRTSAPPRDPAIPAETVRAAFGRPPAA